MPGIDSPYREATLGADALGRHRLESTARRNAADGESVGSIVRDRKTEGMIRAVKLALPLLGLALVAAACAPMTPPQSSSSQVTITYEPIEQTPEALAPAVEPAETLPAPDPETAAASAEERLGLSLEAYESADSFWMEGSFEDAFDALDRSYDLMSEVDSAGDDLLAQQKQDLRRLISRKIVEIYASQRTVVGDFEGSIPLDVNDYVQREIRSFQGPERADFLAGYRRSGLYREKIVERLREAGMPEELAWLPMVESWFKVRAMSRARALGMWQFIPSTGYRYGLKRTSWTDERMDPDKATRAALAYLGELHELFGDWLTAIAGYNCGEARVQRLLREQSEGYFDQFWDLYERLPRETRRYVPRFLATVLIVQNPARFGFSDLPEPLPPIETEQIETTRSIRLADLDKQLNLPEGSLAGLNPELRNKATPDGYYRLSVPTERAQIALAALVGVPRTEVPSASPATVHLVRRGETLSTIAQRYGTSVSSVMRLNNIRNADRISPGQRLRVDGRAPAASSASPTQTTYTVRRGDSLWIIARRFGTKVDRIQRENGLRGTNLRPGQLLTIAAGSTGRTHVVRRGDTLGRIASSNRVSVRRLAEANGLTLRSTIYPGTRLRIPN